MPETLKKIARLLTHPHLQRNIGHWHAYGKGEWPLALRLANR